MQLREALAPERIASAPVEADLDEPRQHARLPAGIRRRGLSLLRASVGERLCLVAAVLVLLWLAVYWALQ